MRIEKEVEKSGVDEVFVGGEEENRVDEVFVDREEDGENRVSAMGEEEED